MCEKLNACLCCVWGEQFSPLNVVCGLQQFSGELEELFSTIVIRVFELDCCGPGKESEGVTVDSGSSLCPSD